jgi:hypothetical protein
MESHIFWTFSDFGERSPMKIPESELILENLTKSQYPSHPAVMIHAQIHVGES